MLGRWSFILPFELTGIFVSVFEFILLELAEMGCEKDSSAQDISIPAVLIPKSGGESLNRSILDGQKGDH